MSVTPRLVFASATLGRPPPWGRVSTLGGTGGLLSTPRSSMGGVADSSHRLTPKFPGECASTTHHRLCRPLTTARRGQIIRCSRHQRETDTRGIHPPQGPGFHQEGPAARFLRPLYAD